MRGDAKRSVRAPASDPAEPLIRHFFGSDTPVASVVFTLRGKRDLAAHRTRQAVVGLLENSDLFSGHPMDVVIAAHELASNAVSHGRPPSQLAIVSNQSLTVVGACDAAPPQTMAPPEPFRGLWVLGRLSSGGVHVFPSANGGKWVAVALESPGNEPIPIL
jgi:hypothetical protein